MTVQELITQLDKVDDKSIPVVIMDCKDPEHTEVTERRVYLTDIGVYEHRVPKSFRIY